MREEWFKKPIQNCPSGLKVEATDTAFFLKRQTKNQSLAGQASMTVAKHGNGQHPSVVYQSSKEWNIGPTSLCFAQLTCCRFSIVVITPIID